MNDRQHLPSALYGRSEAYAEEAEADDPDIEQRDTHPCPPPQDRDEEAPESDGKPVEYPHLLSARRMSDE